MHVLGGANGNRHTVSTLPKFHEKIQAVLEIPKKIFQSEGGSKFTLSVSPPFMGEALSEERACYNSQELMKWVGIF